MDKRRVIYIIEWVIALAACGWLVWKLATYEDYAALGECLRSMGWTQWIAIAVCVALMPVNMALEAWRWRTLWNDEMSREQGSLNEPLTLNDAQRQVYYSKLAGLITPWRLGEYPARGLLMNGENGENGENGGIWPKVLSMGAVGSATMTVAIVATGMIALSLEIGNWQLENEYIYFVGAVLVLLILALVLAPRVLKRYADVSRKLIVISIGQSLVRLACWCVQLALVLYALGAISIQPSVISFLFIYYLLVTVTPNVPVAEAGVRGAWAIVVFGTVNAALAGVLLWGINTLLPCVIGLFLSKKR
jgi:hypothetical protein